jgi:hypothetical protein
MPLSCVVLVITPAVLFYVALADFKEFKIAGLFACTVVPGSFLALEVEMGLAANGRPRRR